MRTVQVEDVCQAISSLLGEVARGETIIIVKDSVPAATLAPTITRERIEESFAEMDRPRSELREVPASADEVLEMIREGRGL